MASKKSNSDICNNNSEENFPNFKSLPHYSNKKLPLFSLMLQSTNSEEKLRPTRSQLKQELVSLPLSISQSPLDLLGSIPHKSTSSTLWTSLPRSSRVKSKSPKTSRSAPRTKKSKLQRLPFLRSSTSNHSNMVWKSKPSMTKDTFFLKPSLTLTLTLSSPNSKLEPETSLDFHFQLVFPLLLLFLSSSVTLSKTLLRYQLSLGIFFDNLDIKLKKLRLPLVPQLLLKKKPRNKSPRNKPKRKSPRRKLPHLLNNRTWIWETCSVDRI